MLDIVVNRCCFEFSVNYYSIYLNNMRLVLDVSSIVSYVGKLGRNVSKKCCLYILFV